MKPVILTAPTAAGKTGLALRIAEHHSVEIVSADAFLVYRGMDVGTAKPSRVERERVRHHLIDIRDPWEEYDVTQFVRDAEEAIRDVLARGRIPLVVGGTGFYLSALLGGLPTTPRSDAGLQRVIEEELRERGLDAVLAEIEAVRPAELVRLQRNPRRVVRSLEIYRRTGRFPSEFPRTVPAFSYSSVAFSPAADVLDARIEGRVRQMFQEGLVDEVRWLLKTLGEPGERQTAWQAIGYKEVAALVRSEVTMDQAMSTVVQATRSYAKRQLTWIRTQLKLELLSSEDEAGERIVQLLGG